MSAVAAVVLFIIIKSDREFISFRHSITCYISLLPYSFLQTPITIPHLLTSLSGKDYNVEFSHEINAHIFYTFTSYVLKPVLLSIAINSKHCNWEGLLRSGFGY